MHVFILDVLLFFHESYQNWDHIIHTNQINDLDCVYIYLVDMHIKTEVLNQLLQCSTRKNTKLIFKIFSIFLKKINGIKKINKIIILLTKSLRLMNEGVLANSHRWVHDPCPSLKWGIYIYIFFFTGENEGYIKVECTKVDSIFNNKAKIAKYNFLYFVITRMKKMGVSHNKV